MVMNEKDPKPGNRPDPEPEAENASGLKRRDVLKWGAMGAGSLAAGFLMSDAFAQSQTTSATSESLLYKVLKRGRVTVGTYTANPPWHFKDAKGDLVGMDIDMGRLVAHGLFNDPSKVDFVLEGPDARIPNLLTNKVDVVIQFMTINDPRAQQVEFTDPYYREGVALMLQTNSKYADYQALKAAGSSVRVSVLQNVSAEDLVHEALPAAQVIQLSTQGAVIQALGSGRVDAAAVDQSTSKYLSQLHPTQYKDSGYGWYPQNYGFAIKPGDFVWLTFLNAVLGTAMSGDDFQLYRAAFKKWFGEDLPSPHIGYPLIV